MSSSESRKGSKLSTPDIGDKPHQPFNFHFPQREFCKTSVVKRSFQNNWFQRWPWLHYDEEQDLNKMRFFLHVLLPTRIISCILSLVWRKHLFPLASRTGRMLLPNCQHNWKFFLIILSVKTKWFCLMF